MEYDDTISVSSLVKNEFEQGKRNLEPNELDAELHTAYYFQQKEAQKALEVADKNQISYRRDKKILIVYTGGTIGMMKTIDGLKPRKNFLFEYMLNHPNLCDKEFTVRNANGDWENCLITPITVFQKRVIYKILEYEDPIDSTDMNLKKWLQIANTIGENYDHFDGFVILHGTDTMSYTASILSFMLENLNKPVVVTGSQIPLCEMRNDALSNLIDAITVAGTLHIPEVCLMFNTKLHRGNRSIKNDNLNLDAFDSPNFRPLVEVAITWHINWDLVTPSPSQRFVLFTELNDRICIKKYFPSISDEEIRNLFNDDVDAVVLETFGAGNLPLSRKVLHEELKKAKEKKILIVNVSQCRKGLVTSAYETGRALEKIGVVFAGDLTVECALAKVSYLLGKGYRDDEFREMMKENLRGELTEIKTEYNVQSNSFIESIQNLANMDTFDINIVQKPNGEAEEEKEAEQKNEEATNQNEPEKANEEEDDGFEVPMRQMSKPRPLVRKRTFPCFKNNPTMKESDEMSVASVIDNKKTSTSDVKIIAESLLPILINELAEKENLPLLYKLESEVRNIKFENIKQRNPLHVSSIVGNLEMCEFFVKCGVKVNLVDQYYKTALNYACMHKHLQIINFLLNKGAILSADEDYSSILCYLAMKGDLESLKFYHMAGANLMVGDYDKRTALHIAAAEDKLDIIKFIVEETDYDYNCKDRWGNAPKDCADGKTAKYFEMIERKKHRNFKKPGSSNIISDGKKKF